MKKTIIIFSFILVATTLFVAKTAHAATLDVCPSGCTYSTIQAAITAAAAGDTITIGAGTYTVTTSMAVLKTLTFQGDGSYPQIFFNVGGGASNNIFNITADNVTFKNLEIYSPVSTNGTRSNYAITYTSGLGLLIDDCKFHDLKRALYVTGGTTFTIQNSQLSTFNRPIIDVEGGTGAFTITRNWIYDASFLGGSTNGVLIGNRDNFAGGVGEISYNYIEGARAVIEYNPAAASAPTSGSLLIAHNTMDNTWTSTTSYYGANILTPSYNTQGIGIYDPAGHGLNSAAITIRDNIIVNTRWYGTHYNGGATGVLSGNLSIANSIYWNNYWDAVASGETPVHYANEWSGTATNPQIGWQGAGTGIISPNAATKTLDPLFVGGAKTVASSYYALGSGSPACSAASDGQNIGAWQGSCPLPPATAVDLGSASSFAILTHAGITDSPTSIITGNIGTDGVGSSITGLSVPISCPEVAGTVYAMDATGPACTITNPTLLGTAMTDEQTAYTTANGQATSVLNTGNGAGEIGGQTLVPGVYTFTGGSINVKISTALTLNGSSTDVWVFQIPGTFDVGATATPASVILSGGALSKNVFWTVAGATTIHPGSTLYGTILDYAGIAMQNGATLNGRAFSHTASVTLIANTITIPTGATPAPPTVGVATAAGISGTHVIVYTLTTGTLDSTNGITTSNWTLGGTNIADLGSITGVVLSSGNKVATITVSGTVGASGQNYTLGPLQAAFSAGFTIPAAVATITTTAAPVIVVPMGGGGGGGSILFSPTRPPIVPIPGLPNTSNIVPGLPNTGSFDTPNIITINAIKQQLISLITQLIQQLQARVSAIIAAGQK